jgi:hypothetical protein
MNPWLLNKRKNALRAAVSAFASVHRDKIKVVATDFTEPPDPDTGEPRLDEVKLTITGPKGGAVSMPYPITMWHLGEDPKKWPERFAEKVGHMVKSLKQRGILELDPGRQDLPGA